MRKLLPVAAVIGAALCAFFGKAQGAKASADSALLARGRYLVVIGGCNDCHTDGWAESGGTVPVKDWLEGSRVGWHGPWGTSYPSNLRLLFSRLSERDWVRLAGKGKLKPPMPWWALHAMTREDQRAVYRFIRSLGPAGKEAPTDLPSGVAPPPPAILFPMPGKKAGR